MVSSGTEHPVIVYPSSGTGAWEAALVNCLSPGDRILAFETGHFATLWRDLAARHGLVVDFVAGDWRHGVDPEVVEEALARDRAHEIRAVTVIHNETSTGVCSPVAGRARSHGPRRASGAPSRRHDLLARLDRVRARRLAGRRGRRVLAEGPDAATGPRFQRAEPEGPRRRRAAPASTAPYWDWRPIIEANQDGFYPYTLPTNLLVALVGRR